MVISGIINLHGKNPLIWKIRCSFQLHISCIINYAKKIKEICAASFQTNSIWESYMKINFLKIALLKDANQQSTFSVKYSKPGRGGKDNGFSESRKNLTCFLMIENTSLSVDVVFLDLELSPGKLSTNFSRKLDRKITPWKYVFSTKKISEKKNHVWGPSSNISGEWKLWDLYTNLWGSPY